MARALARWRHSLDVMRRPGLLPTGGARLRWLYWRHVRRYDGEVCHCCGRPVARGIGSWWHAPDVLWAPAAHYGILCPRCFVSIVEAAWPNVMVSWVARYEDLR